MQSEMAWPTGSLISISIVFFWCFSVLRCALALTSDGCMRAWPGFLKKCVKPSCGYVEESLTEENFIDSLTPACHAILQQFSGREQVIESLPIRERTCPTYEQASRPTNPVVVQTDVTPTFVMCTVPKAGCSQLRTLLLVMTRCGALPVL